MSLPRLAAGGAGAPPGSARQVSGVRLPGAAIASRLFLDEHLSPLAFTERVLELAEDPAGHAAERARFLALAAGNLDEYVSVRLGTLWTSPASDHARLGLYADRVQRITQRASSCFRHCVRPALASVGLSIQEWAELGPAMRDEAARELTRLLQVARTPLSTTFGCWPAHIPGQRLALAIVDIVDGAGSGASSVCLMPLPAALPRFLRLCDGRTLVPTEEVVAACLTTPNGSNSRAYAFRLTRADDAPDGRPHTSDPIAAARERIARRPYQPAVRLEISASAPEWLPELLRKRLAAEGTGSRGSRNLVVHRVDGPLDLGGLHEIAAQMRPLKLSVSRAPAAWSGSLFDALRAEDRLVYLPHDRYDATVQRFFDAAADDPDVVSLQATIYRTESQSRVIDALVRARRAGKRVRAIIELAARFDEARNLRWAELLRGAGLEVGFGRRGRKVHAKIALAERRSNGEMQRYALVSSGNLNAATARHYTDVALLTADPAIGVELGWLFDRLFDRLLDDTQRSGRSDKADRFARLGAKPIFSHLLVSPGPLRRRLLALIEREAAAGGGGRIRAKLNGLDDPGVIAALYRASRAGVSVELAVRGVCTLRPGLRGLSERIRVVSRVGRLLEHARIYAFGADPDTADYFIGSADWRVRNLSRRVEVAVRVRAPAARQRLEAALTAEFADPTAWELRADGSYVRSGTPCAARYSSRAAAPTDAA